MGRETQTVARACGNRAAGSCAGTDAWKEWKGAVASMTPMMHSAPGHPGISPRWTSSRKSGVGTAIEARSRVWFTISHGILNEVYYPRVDQANTRDLGLLVTS